MNIPLSILKEYTDTIQQLGLSEVAIEIVTDCHSPEYCLYISKEMEYVYKSEIAEQQNSQGLNIINMECKVLPQHNATLVINQTSNN